MPQKYDFRPAVRDLVSRIKAAGFYLDKINDGGEEDEEIDPALSPALQIELVTDGICAVSVSELWVTLNGYQCWLEIVLDELPHDIVCDYQDISGGAFLSKVIDQHSDHWAAPSSDTITITLPTIHLNGTGKATLERTYGEAADKLEDFVDAWGQTEFNSRDYYVQGPEAWDRAVTEREEMNSKIREVKTYLQKIREHIHQ